jgi:hypothetical protein
MRPAGLAGPPRAPHLLSMDEPLPDPIIDREEDQDDAPDYGDPGDISESELRTALCDLRLLDDDPYLRMQALNLSVVDQFVMSLEYDTSVIGGEPSRFVDGVAWRPRFMLLSVIDAMIVT